MKRIPICECFGPCVQGEGHHYDSRGEVQGYGTGTPTVFVRVGGCDSRCKGCDSRYASDPRYSKEWKRMSASMIVDRVQKLSACPWLVTLTGGNPALYDCENLIFRLHESGRRVAMETQATIYQPWFQFLDCTTLSPKPPSFAGKMSDLNVLDRCVYASRNPQLKVLVSTHADFTYAISLHKRYPRIPFVIQLVNTKVRGRVDLKALCKTESNVLRWLEEINCVCTKVLVQQHVLLHGNKRGV